MDNKLEPFLTLEVRNAIFQHMVEAGEHECCGLITLSSGEYKYVPQENVSANPTETFSFSKEVKAKMSRSKSVVAIAHSHPNGPDTPSAMDMKTQISLKAPSVIAYRNPDTGVVGIFSFGDHLLDAELVGRDFRYNQFDCVQALRSWVWQNEKRYMPPPPPSDNGWWMRGADNAEELTENLNLYERNFERYGYKVYTPDLDGHSEWSPRVGDVLLMQLGAPVINHAAVYVGDNLVYHHRAGKQSNYNPIGYFLNMGYIRKWVRHESKL
jgi:proteasome lid subunit RPN8/RPN11